MRQSLKEQQVMAALTELMGSHERKTVQQIRDALKAEGLLDIDLDEHELELTRGYIARQRKRCQATKDVQLEIVNLKDVAPDGTVTQYYRVMEALTVEESRQLLIDEHGCLTRQSKKFHRYYQYLRKRHGAKLQRMLPFPIPEKIVEAAAEAV